MEKLQLFLFILQMVIAVVMIILILLQKSDGDSLGGIGGGSGGAGSVMSSKASASFLSKFTMFLAAAFMANCLVLAAISGKTAGKTESEFERIIEKQGVSGEKSAKPIKKRSSVPEVK